MEFDTWEIGYVFNSKYWHKGYATEACVEFIKCAFEKLNAHRVIAECNPINEASWKLMERLNMRRESFMIKNNSFEKEENGQPIWIDTYQYAILKEEWNSKIK